MWYYAINNQQQKPVELIELIRLFKSGTLPAHTLVWTSGMLNWETADSVSELAPYLNVLSASPPPESSDSPSLYATTPNDEAAPAVSCPQSTQPTPTTQPMPTQSPTPTLQPPDPTLLPFPAAGSTAQPKSPPAESGYIPVLTKHQQTEMSVRILWTWKFYAFFMVISLLFMSATWICRHFPFQKYQSVYGQVGLSNIQYETIAELSLYFGIVLYISTLIFQCILLYRLWEVVPYGIANTTPGKAVCGLFLPIFNLFWVFIAYGSLANRYQEISLRENVPRNYYFLSVLPFLVCLFPYYAAIFILSPFLTLIYFSCMAGAARVILERAVLADQPDLIPEIVRPQGYVPQSQKDINLVIPDHTSGLAIAAGHLGFISVLIFPAAPLALIFGFLALRQLNRQPGLRGYVRAWIGIVLGAIFSVFLLLIIFFNIFGTYFIP